MWKCDCQALLRTCFPVSCCSALSVPCASSADTAIHVSWTRSGSPSKQSDSVTFSQGSSLRPQVGFKWTESRNPAAVLKTRKLKAARVSMERVLLVPSRRGHCWRCSQGEGLPYPQPLELPSKRVSHFPLVQWLNWCGHQQNQCHEVHILGPPFSIPTESEPLSWDSAVCSTKLFRRFWNALQFDRHCCCHFQFIFVPVFMGNWYL